MKGMLLTMDDRQPKYLLDDGIIGSNPGLGFRPISDNAHSGALIWFQATNDSNYRTWTDQLDKFLEPYKITQKLPGGGKNQQQCDFDRNPDYGKVCAVDPKQFEPCTSEMGYGYNRSSPCIFIKLNKIYGWVPDYYDDPRQLPAEMPLELKEHIRDIYVKDPQQYVPGPGFPGYYYPYRNIDGYLSPLIAVQLRRPHWM
ncbi:Sodium/potassium-transporting ATPase subunit beta-2 [Blattella germanica]|nr:Sodium/potassium-transporting ATPase subunit beta-2 [Blattella germanica]